MSSAQPRDLSLLIARHKPEIVVVKLYQKIEVIPQDWSRAQIESAQDNGCQAGGYFWLYRDLDPFTAVNDVLDLAESCGLDLPVLWIDVEDYTDGSIPRWETVRDALTACDERGVTGGIYTSISMWAKLNAPDIPEGIPLWTANYGSAPDLEGTPLYGGWTREWLRGHQWTSTPVDQNVFLL